ncbi:MAG: hypothetical protein ABSA40_06520, partial [Candidatus Dormibacteria bacterium]
MPLTSTVSADPITVTTRFVESIGDQLLPSLFGSRYCCVLTAVTTLAAATSYAVSRVGEKVGEVPAPASMIAP